MMYNTEFKKVKTDESHGVSVVQNRAGKWGVISMRKGVINMRKKVIVPFGRYDWIDSFDHGLARVNRREGDYPPLWGIIDTKGEEVLEVRYDAIWNFAGKGRSNTTVEDYDGDYFEYKFDLTTHRMYPYIPPTRSKRYSLNRMNDEEDDYEPYESVNYNTDYMFDDDAMEAIQEREYDAYMDGEYLPEDW